MDFKTIEKKWQDNWANKNVFKASMEQNKKKHYILEMFPYPSASGLHMGHALNYSIGDIFARFKRMQGYSVLYPMGFDSFGLPAENAAIKAKSHPKQFTEEAIKNYIKQMNMLGLSYDWSRMVETHKPDYYKWDQWIFLKMFEQGLAYKKEAPVNWCPDCNTVLANEQVHNGMCWRHDTTAVQVKHLSQWFLKTTAYAEELNNFERLPHWPETIKKLQKNWIGKSFGTEIIFEINNKPWKIFTTRPDTLYGVTFMVVSAQHAKLDELVTPEQKDAVDAFRAKINSVSEEDIDKVEKEGVFTGSYALHPLTQEKIPVYAGNFVLAEYGSGMVMAVPAHDQRDFEFAKKYAIPIKIVINPQDATLTPETLQEAYTKEGVLVHSESYSGLDTTSAKEKITAHLQEKGKGKQTVQYRLRDWLISRQRFWGTPIPIIHCTSCGAVPVPENELPVVLPEDVVFEDGKNPLNKHDAFLQTTCPVCKKPAKRETDTMDTFANSSWYYLRYMDPQNKDVIFDKEKANYWGPVDTYIGGKEHACMHLIYIRFYTKFLRDLGLLSFDEPTIKLFNQGMLHGPDGEKMSKSKGNVVLPETVSEKYGIDAARLFLVSVANPDKDIDWSDEGAQGSLRFITKIVQYKEQATFQKSDALLQSKLHKAIKGVTSDIQNFQYNAAIVKLRDAFSYFDATSAQEDFEIFLKLLHPFCPHITEELWEQLGHDKYITTQDWPVPDESKIDEAAEAAADFVDAIKSDVKKVIDLAHISHPKKITIIVSAEWKYELFTMLKEELEKSRNPKDILQAIMSTHLKQYGQDVMKIVPGIIKDESKLPKLVLSEEKEYTTTQQSTKELEKVFGCEIAVLHANETTHPKVKQASPGKPAIIVE
jgi:leucyl-tRNA synthetase